MKWWMAAVLALSLALAACGDDEVRYEYDREEAFRNLGLEEVADEAALEKAYGRLANAPIDPPPAVGKDYHPEFPAPIPFDPSEWETGTAPPSVADARAVKGGRIRLAVTDWPPTIRTEGPNSRLAFLSNLHQMVYETLLDFDEVTMRYVPNAATHWRMADDKMTYWFRLDPRARWADGREVTADDVVATLEHLTNPDRKDPLVNKKWDEAVESARVLDKYTVEIRAREPRWRTFLELADEMLIYPAAYIRMDGATYLEDWSWKLPPGSGPYEIRPEDIKKGASITLRRRKDWWRAELPEMVGFANFDEIEWKIVRDQELMYQKLLAGELDMYRVTRATRWVGELDREKVIQKGWVQKRKIYCKVPQGYGGFCFNMRNPPFDDVRTRRAFAHLFNREQLFEKLFLYQYLYLKSYFPDLPYQREGARRRTYDSKTARALLKEAGWTKRDASGHLTNDKGKRFPKLTLEFGARGLQRIFEVVKHDLWDEAGIEMELKVLDYASLLKKVWDYQFTVVFWNWTGSFFPDPKTQFHSKFADPKNTNNLNGLKNEEVDRITTDYRTEFDPQKRIEMLQRLDEILFDQTAFALGWYGPFFRILYWDKFGHPPEYTTRSERDWLNIMRFWWFDADRAERLTATKSANRGAYPESGWELNQYDSPEQRHWLKNDLPMAEDGGASR